MKNKRSRPTPELTRRKFALKTLGMLSLAMGGAALSSSVRATHHEATEPGGTKLVTDFERNKLMLSQVQFVAVSPQPDQRCENCTMFWGREGSHGHCALFQQGKVPGTAWCTSWTKKWTSE